jgi:hypothetical protein
MPAGSSRAGWPALRGDLCSFCGLRRPGGVAGQGTPKRVYICPDCIRLSREMVGAPEQVETADPVETADRVDPVEVPQPPEGV